MATTLRHSIPFLFWPNGWMHQDATEYGGRPHPRGLCVAWGPSPPPQTGGRAYNFSGHMCCGQMTAWIKMPLGMAVGLGPDDIVLVGDPAPSSSKRGQSAPPQFPAQVYCGQTANVFWLLMHTRKRQTKRWIDTPRTFNRCIAISIDYYYPTPRSLKHQPL